MDKAEVPPPPLLVRLRNTAENRTMTSYAGKHVVVTGGLGFIGSNLAIRLLELGASVTIVDSLIPETGGNAFNIEPVRDHPRLTVRTVDVRDVLAMERLVRDQEVIFNLAGQVSHIDSMRDPFTDRKSTRLNSSHR